MTGKMNCRSAVVTLRSLWSTQPKGHGMEQPHPRLITLTYFPPTTPLFGYQTCPPPPLRWDISQPLNNKSDTLGTSPASFLPFRQLNGPVMSSCSHDSRHDRGLGGGLASFGVTRRSARQASLPGATLRSPRQPRLRSRLTYLQQYFLIQGRDGRAQIIVIMFSGCCRHDYVRCGAKAVALWRSLVTVPTCELRCNVFDCCPEWCDCVTITTRYRERWLEESVSPFEIK